MNAIVLEQSLRTSVSDTMPITTRARNEAYLASPYGKLMLNMFVSGEHIFLGWPIAYDRTTHEFLFELAVHTKLEGVCFSRVVVTCENGQPITLRPVHREYRPLMP